ncbi:MAG: GDSL-type esterase/lipase family protein [Myxococcota bacterium]
MSTRSIGGLAAFALLLGCGGCKPAPESSEISAAPATDPAPSSPSSPAALTPVAAPTPQTAAANGLGEDARRARVSAQTALLGDALFEDAAGQQVPWISPQSATVTAAEVAALDDAVLDSLPGSSGLSGTEAPTRHVNGNALGEYQPLTIATADAKPLARFYAALRELEAGRDPDGKVRVLMYGASHTDADIYTHYIRAYLRERFGDGGHGFVHVAKPWKWYGHVEMLTEGFDRWRTEHAQRRKGRDDGYYGLMGASLSATSKKAWGRVTHRDGSVGSNYELYYLSQPKGGSFKVFVDGAQHAKVSTKADAFAAGYYAIDLPEGAHSIEVRPVGNGEVRLFGMTIERDTPGIVVDTLGIGGTRASNMLRWSEDVWYDNVRRRQPDLITLAYGTNEANSGISRERYATRLRDVLTRLKTAAPQADCLLVGPGDFPKKGAEGVYGPRESTSYILEAQREVALEMGCAFWDLRAFMGGEMAMVDWATATPAMAKKDHIHFTRRGYVRVGMGIVDAMMAGFDGNDVLANSTPD